MHPMAQTHKQTHGHGDSMTNSAQRVRVGEKNTFLLTPKPLVLKNHFLHDPPCPLVMQNHFLPNPPSSDPETVPLADTTSYILNPNFAWVNIDVGYSWLLFLPSAPACIISTCISY